MNLAIVAALALAAPVPWDTGAVPPCIHSGISSSVSTVWAEPLDRIVSFRVNDLSLREALDRLAAVARIRISYSSEALPLDRLVCVALDSVPMGDVLTILLEGARVGPVAAGSQHVVLSPIRVSMATLPDLPPIVIDRIVVTGSPTGSAWKPLPVALDVVEGGALAGRTVGTLAEAFNSLVPGLWMWEPSPSSLLARYGSIRGTSSFGLSYPKLYIDGIQVANPLLFTRISPETIERIEVIRGPQGAALYGADAISGVANIVMRHATADAGAPRAQLRTGFGLASSDFGSNPSVGQDHVLTVSAGSNTHSFGASFEGGGTGAFIPGAYRRKVAATSTVRAVSARSVLTGTLRFFGEQAGTPASPLLPAPPVVTVAPAPGAPAGQSAVQFTAGTNLKFSPTDRLTHTMVLGVDGYSLDGVVADDRLPIPSAADAALLAARGGADRITLHLGTVARLVRGSAFSTDLSLVGEQSLLYQWTDSDPGPAVTGTSLWRNNSGASGQLNVGFLDHLFLTGGMRVERSSDNDRTAGLPMLGSSLVLGQGLVRVKLRAAYGKGIRWPETAVRETMWKQQDHAPITLPLPANLAPEEQAGLEAGLDLLVGSALSLQFTRFDQTASGLIQRVLIQVDTVLRKPSGEYLRVRRAFYQMQNVGEITNRGWELQGSLGGGPVSLTGTLSLTDSRVRATARNYTGDLQPGDRMLDVPRLTMGGTVTWSTPTFGASLTATRANDWLGYNRLKLAQEFANVSREGTDFIGKKLREGYWMAYGGVTHLRATLTKSITPNLALSLTGENLLNHQRGEPDNITVMPGRTITLGFRAEL